MSYRGYGTHLPPRRNVTPVGKPARPRPKPDDICVCGHKYHVQECYHENAAGVFDCECVQFVHRRRKR